MFPITYPSQNPQIITDIPSISIVPKQHLSATEPKVPKLAQIIPSQQISSQVIQSAKAYANATPQEPPDPPPLENPPPEHNLNNHKPSRNALSYSSDESD